MKPWRICVLAACVPVALGLVAPSGLAAGKRQETKVVCIGKGLEREYKVRPRSCVFHRRHAPLVEASFVRTKHDRWKVWNRRHARGKGRNVGGMGASSRVRIRLSNPVTKCGHRVFSKAHFRFPKLGSSGTLKLDLCAHR